MQSQEDDRSDRPDDLLTGVKPRRPGDVDAAAGRRLKARRVTLNMTQQELGALCHVSPQQIHKYEMGASKMTLARLLQFGQALRVPVSWFVEGIEMHPGLPEDLVGLLSDPENVQMLLVFNRITDGVARSGLIHMAEGYARQTSPPAKPPRAATAKL